MLALQGRPPPISSCPFLLLLPLSHSFSNSFNKLLTSQHQFGARPFAKMKSSKWIRFRQIAYSLVVEIATQTIMARCVRCCNRGVYQLKHTSEEGATDYGGKAIGRLNKDGDISTGSWWKNLSSPDCYSPYSSSRSKLSSIVSRLFPLQVTTLRL